MKLFIYLVLLLSSFQTYALEIVIGSSVGSGNDTATRVLKEPLERELNETVKIVNMPGKNGAFSFKYMTMQKSDDNVVLMAGTNALLLNKLDPDLNVNIFQQYDVVSSVVNNTVGLYVNSKSNIKNLEDLKQQSNSFNVGTSSDMESYIIKQLADQLKFNYKDIRYKEQNDIFRDLSNGIIDLSVGGFGKKALQGYIDSNMITPLVILNNTKSLAYPKLKTLQEYGYNNVEAFSWAAYFVKKDAPEEFKLKLQKAFAAAKESAEVKKFENGPGKMTLWRAPLAEVYKQMSYEDTFLTKIVKK